ncbi:MAG: T9SS type A sorting domain-containing protein [Ignavibacteriae bacterium]|nr:T9SS type A sorting domain-containing protein [Ignavibacteriota bacterium]
MLKFYKKHILVSVIALFLVFGISVLLYAYGNGVAGCTLKTHTTGCNCHSTTSDVAINVTLTGPDTVFAGSTNDFTFSVSRTSGSFTKGGIDVAVSSGTLGLGTSTGLKILSGELVHSTKFNGPTTKTFTFTAPSTPGPVTMYATGAGGTGTPPWNNAQNKTIIVKTTTGVENNTTSATFSLSQNYPNPFNPITKIDYRVAKTSKVKLSVYDILGNKIMSLVNQKQEAGSYSVDFDGSKLSSGTYIYKIETSDFSSTKKMLMIK